jgi:predicted RecB family endonuclease
MDSESANRKLRVDPRLNMAEIAKQSTWCETPLRMYHFRDSDVGEIDLVPEVDHGYVVAIEFKASSTHVSTTSDV